MEKELAKHLLEIGAVKLNPETPFTWASGWKSPIYCDNRQTLAYPKIRKKITMGLFTLVCNFFPGITAVAGVATGGIPHAAWLAEKMGLPLLYVRSEKKAHGTGNLIEGKLEEDSRVLLVEDLVSTGNSAVQAVKALRDAGATVVGIVSIFSYGFDAAQKNMETNEIKLASITDYETLLEVAVETKVINKSQLKTLELWRKNPDKWGV
ncbi:MAG TPA: orotate phosphoribosyltransferase [Cytophagales bacterium]|nr:orotate phosphoribosyltransferase [Cytophagales bacterium]